LRFVSPTVGAQRAEQVPARCGEALASGAFAPLLAEIEDACSSASRSDHFGRNASV
jgi:hypothetical protein